MFWILAILGVAGACGSGFWFVAEERNRALSGCLFVLCIIIFISGWFTPLGKIYAKQIFAGSVSGNWLVIDNSGGKTMRHWIIKDGYVKSSSQSDGWEFTDAYGNLCYVSGDSYKMQIHQSLREFLKNYKIRYNVPIDQVALE